MEHGKTIRVTPGNRRVQGWLTAAGIVGMFSMLVGRLAGTPLGWLAAFAGAAVGLSLPQVWPDSKAGRWLGRIRWGWSLPVLAVTLQYCVAGVTEYSYPGWNCVVPAALVVLLGWRGSCLDGKARERYGKLLMWGVSAAALLLVAFTIYMVSPQRLLPRTGKDLLDGLWLFLISAGAVSFLLPAEGRLPGLVSAGLGASMVAVTTGAESAALAGVLQYPFLTLCNAGAYQLRLGVLATALWVVGEAAILARVLADSPGGKWGKAFSGAVVFLLSVFMPKAEGWKLFLLAVGGTMGYVGLLLGLRTQGRYASGKKYTQE